MTWVIVGIVVVVVLVVAYALGGSSGVTTRVIQTSVTPTPDASALPTAEPVTRAPVTRICECLCQASTAVRGRVLTLCTDNPGNADCDAIFELDAANGIRDEAACLALSTEPKGNCRGWTQETESRRINGKHSMCNFITN